MAERDPRSSDPGVRAWVVAGPAGSGKSTLGRALARSAGAALLDQDVLTNPVVGVVASLLGEDPHDLDAPAVREKTRDARYAALLAVAADNVAIGRSVVLVAPFTTEARDAPAWEGLVRALAPAQVVLVWVDCPGPLLWARMRARAAPRDAGKLRDQAAFLAGLPGLPAVPHVRVDAALSTEAQLAALLTR